MRCNTTLFERLADPERDARRTIRKDTQELADSVMHHLQKLLNTRQGHVPIRPDYGMPDFTDCIESFEPRLRQVRITHLPSEDTLLLHFGISGQLATGRQKISTFFSTRVAPTGSAEVDSRAEVNES
jgi:type VI secretion system protein